MKWKDFWRSLWEHRVGPWSRCAPERRIERHQGPVRGCPHGCTQNYNTMTDLSDKGIIVVLGVVVVMVGVAIIIAHLPK